MTIELDHPTFRATLDDLNASAAELSQTRLALSREVDLLLDGDWSGAAASAYREGWDDWQEGVEQVTRGLTALTELMEATHRDLVGRDLASQASLERLAHRLTSRLGA